MSKRKWTNEQLRALHLKVREDLIASIPVMEQQILDLYLEIAELKDAGKEHYVKELQLHSLQEKLEVVKADTKGKRPIR